jgi:hypothetical protein
MKHTALFAASVIITSLAFVTGYIILAILGFEASKADQPVLHTVQPTLPQQCAKYYNDDSDAWINCMGVGKR